MDTVNRMAIVVFPREPLVDWANSVDPDHPVWIDSIADRGNVYLIPEFETIDEAEEHVEQIYDDIFRNELKDWFEDESLWPEVRSYEMFMEWFDVFYDIVIYDTMKEMIRKK